MKKKIFFLHKNKANLPDIQAYKVFFSSKYDVFDGDLEQYDMIDDKENTILWCMMGLYPRKISALLVIHDYRSLSIGRFASIKDKIKKGLNFQPDLRIFLNDRVKKEMSFRDSVKSTCLDMGVPDWIFDIESDDGIRKGTYGYLGVMSKEREFDKVIDSFLANRKKDEKFVLIGKPEEEIYEKYHKFDCIQFTGFMEQRKALALIKSCEYAVSYFPYHRPHCFQTPTKLLEYAALGVNIICNDSPSNIQALNELNIEASITGRYIFDGLIPKETKYLDESKVKGLLWKDVISSSEIDKMIDHEVFN